jgi:hypothetical protein
MRDKILRNFGRSYSRIRPVRSVAKCLENFFFPKKYLGENNSSRIFGFLVLVLVRDLGEKKFSKNLLRESWRKST